MTRWTRVASGVCLAALLLLSANVFGRQMEALFLRFPGLDKLAHVAAYMALYVVIDRLAASTAMPSPARAALVIAAGTGLAIIDEWVQRFVPGRSVDRWDLVANAAGLGFGWAFVRRRVDGLGGTIAAAALCVAALATWHTYVSLSDFSLGIRYSQQQDFVRAREHFRRAFDAGLRTAGLYNELGWVEIESGIGDPARAVEYARTALDMRPGDPDILDTYGWALHHAGRTGEAIAALEQAYEGKPDMFCIHYHLAMAYEAAGRGRDAELHFRRQVERHGTREAVLAERALARLETRR